MIRVKIAFLLLLTIACNDEIKESTASEVFRGLYRAIDKPDTVLTIEKTGAHYVATLEGGGSTTSLNAPADCYMKSKGMVRDGKLEARFVAVDTDLTTYNEHRAKEEKRELHVEFDSNTALVTRADTFGYCGLGIDFLGSYHLVD